MVSSARECVERILSDERLESLPSQLDHRGDYLSDTTNGSVIP